MYAKEYNSFLGKWDKNPNCLSIKFIIKTPQMD